MANREHRIESMIDMIEQHLLGLAEIAGNRVLALDDNALGHCRELQGCIVSIELTDLDKTLYCHPGSWGIRFSQQKPSRDPDSRIRGRLMALVNLTLQKDKLSTSIQERVEIIGNASVAQKFQKLFSEMDIDWEEGLAHHTGDIFAHRASQGLKMVAEFANSFLQTTTSNFTEYVQEEAQLTPTKIEVENFYSDLRDLRKDADRLKAKIQRLLLTTQSQE